jgi:16S rRNA processing protein RimM
MTVVSDASLNVTEVFLGRFVKPFGIRGELKFVGTDDFWPAVLESKQLEMRWLENGEVQSRPFSFERYRQHGGHFVVRIDGVEDRSDAEAAVGGEVFIDYRDLDVAPPEEARPFQLVGRAVRLEGGRELGKVRSVMFSAAHPVYVVDGPDGEVMIPAVDEFVVGADEETGVITIRPIPGLVDE